MSFSAAVDLVLSCCPGETPGAISQRIQVVHAKALEATPYKCVQEQKYLTPRMASHFFYEALIKRLALTPKPFVDLGCCMGTDLRKLYLDLRAINTEFPKEQLFGADLEPTFVSLGYELFQDEASMRGQFFSVDLLEKIPDREEALPAPIVSIGTFDYAYAGSVLHLFGESDIVLFCQRVSQILNKNGMFVGRHVGRGDAPGLVERTRPPADTNGQLRFLHTAASFAALLQRLGFVDVDVRMVLSDMPGVGVSGNTAAAPLDARQHGFMAFVATWPGRAEGHLPSS
jgi:hypothetical protein